MEYNENIDQLSEELHSKVNAEEKTDFQTIDKTLLDSISIESLRVFDSNIAEIFKKTFYSYSRDDKDISLDGKGGLVNLLLKNWRHAIGVSSFSKSLPTIISGKFPQPAQNV